MAKGENTLGRLNEVLFAELERLDAVDVTDSAALQAEVERSKAVQGVAKEINISARSVLETAKLRAEWAGGYWFHEFNGKITIHGLTPEQAIAATLGDSDTTAARQDDAGTCTLGKVCDGYLYFRAHWCSECGTRFAFRAIGSGKNARPNYCPNCGRKVVTDG